MGRYSDNFPVVLIGGAFGLAWIGKSAYEDAVKAWVLGRLSQWGCLPARWCSSIGGMPYGLITAMTECTETAA